MRRWQLAEDAFMWLLPKGAHRGSTRFGRMGDIVQNPSDVVARGLLAIAVVSLAWRIWPPGSVAGHHDDEEAEAPSRCATGDNQ